MISPPHLHGIKAQSPFLSVCVIIKRNVICVSIGAKCQYYITFATLVQLFPSFSFWHHFAGFVSFFVFTKFFCPLPSGSVQNSVVDFLSVSFLFLAASHFFPKSKLITILWSNILFPCPFCVECSFFYVPCNWFQRNVALLIPYRHSTLFAGIRGPRVPILSREKCISWHAHPQSILAQFGGQV